MQRSTRPLWPWLLTLLAVILVPVVVVVTSFIYKHAIGYVGFHNHVEIWIRPAQNAGLFQPLERRNLSDLPGPTTTVEGLSLPAEWSAHLAEVDRHNNWFKLEVVRPEMPALTIIASPVKRHLLNTDLEVDLRQLAENYAGDWVSFVASFPSEMEMLEQIFDSNPPEPLDSVLLPLFPPRRNYHFETVLLSAKRLTARGKLLLLRSAKRFYFVDVGGRTGTGAVILGPLASRKVDGFLIVWGNPVREDDLLQICGAIDSGNYPLRFPTTDDSPDADNAERRGVDQASGSAPEPSQP